MSSVTFKNAPRDLIKLDYCGKIHIMRSNANLPAAIGDRQAGAWLAFDPWRDFVDELDRIIIKALQEDGRTPFTQIAERAGVSQTTIRSRFRRLFDEGIVRIAGVVDPYALDFQAPAIVGVSVEPGSVDQVARKIIQFPEVSYLVVTLGNIDLIVEVFCRDLPHLSDLITQQIHSIPGVRSTQTLMITRSYKLGYRVPSTLDFEVGKGAHESTNSVDHQD
jgi:Lrp/AsnC family transcriptional regulator for asnA, asnC and gidA